MSDKAIQKPAEPIGRNDLCTCGSNKKYKKCCLDSDSRRKADVAKFLAAHPQLAAKAHLLADPHAMPLYPWMHPFYSGVGKYAPKKEEPKAEGETAPAATPEPLPETTEETPKA